MTVGLTQLNDECLRTHCLLTEAHEKRVAREA
jgi:hypothetical protein